ncbi:MAG: heavy metal translocating P-type ATPase metal-binding domain-containing protein [Chthoniobacter sp.]|uniref:heavy metal translocating P-type ATPase n=1 Tax=Chthoniobacter sp. TaxID=2510640 RepID=UPI0032A700B5
MQAAIEQRVCIHCGTPFRPTAHRPDFCCTGCQFVHDLIARNGLGQFYDLQEGGVPPVQSLVFQKRDYGWLEELARDSTGTLKLDVQGLSCIGCAWLIEKLFSRQPGALAIHVDPTLGQLALRWQPGVFEVVAFARELQSFGYLVGPPGKSAAPASRALTLRLGLCAALALNTMLFTLPRYLGMSSDFEFAPLFQRLTLILGTLSFLIGGSYFFIRTWRSLRQGVLHIDLPISLGLLAAYAGSVFAWTRGAHGFVYFDFVSTFTFLMLAGRWLQQKAVERNRHQLLAAQAEPPPVRLASGEQVPVVRLAPGDVFSVAPGQVVPVLARLCSEGATLGMEWISGEGEAASARRGRLVPAGAMNCSPSAIELEAREPWADSLLAKLLRITPAGAARDPGLERFLRAYIGVVLGLAAAGFCGWWVATGALLPALQVLISVLVVSCPCASGVALPLCRDLATSRMRQLGVFIRDGELWAKLDRVRKILFDKTGTLTLEALSLLNPGVLRLLRTEERATLLAMVQDSLHPVSGCLREQLLAEHVEPASAGLVSESVGFGLEMEQDGGTWRLGRAEWAAPGTDGDCIFSRDGEPLAAFRFGEEARDDAREELATLRASGCEVFILSGDRRAKVDAMADRLHLPREHCFGELSPEEKAGRVRQIDARDTLYLGDGANDSLAFDAAWISGTPAIDRGLLEQKAGFYFLGRGLNGVRVLLATAALRRRTALAVVAFALTYNTVAVVLCLAGRMSPLLAAILMPASSLVSLAIVFAGFRRRPTG